MGKTVFLVPMTARDDKEVDPVVDTAAEPLRVVATLLVRLVATVVLRHLQVLHRIVVGMVLVMAMRARQAVHSIVVHPRYAVTM